MTYHFMDWFITSLDEIVCYLILTLVSGPGKRKMCAETGSAELLKKASLEKLLKRGRI
jgi:hypothetical protein